MILSPGLRKLALTAHVVCSVGWIGALASFLALAIAAVTRGDTEMVRGAYLAMDLTARFVILPLAFASLLTGVLQSLGTTWGLIRHYWVIVKLLLTMLAAGVLVAKLGLIAYAARLASEPVMARDDLRGVGLQLLVHAAGGLVVLLIAAVLSVYKPRGVTRYGSKTSGT